MRCGRRRITEPRAGTSAPGGHKDVISRADTGGRNVAALVRPPQLWMATYGSQIVSKPATWFDWCEDQGNRKPLARGLLLASS